MTVAPTPVQVAVAHLDDHRVRVEPPIPGDELRADAPTRVLVLRHGVPRRWVECASLPCHDVLNNELESLGDVPAHRGVAAEPTASARLEPATVVICTRGRPEQLKDCLERVTSAASADTEILVVDNAPTSQANAAVVAGFDGVRRPVRRVVEPQPGLSRARNRGVDAADGQVVVFVDDDTRPTAGWDLPLRRSFQADPAVGIATGLVPPARLATEAQRAFEARLHWSDDLHPTVYRAGDAAEHGPLFPFAAGRFGTGANMAVRRSAALALGGFDVHLGAGARTRGGEDLEFFVRAIRRGWSLAHVPASVVWHVHADDLATARRNMFGYGAGLAAYLCATALQPGRSAMLAALGHGVRHALDERRASSGGSDPVGGLSQELRGLAWGPAAYAIERLMSRPRFGKPRQRSHT